MYGQHQYHIKYYVDYKIRMTIDKNTIYEMGVLPVFKLFDTTSGGFDGWPHNDNSKKTLIITPENWKNIALVAVSESKLSELISRGAELKNSNYIFDDEIDAKIQLAFTASKYNVEPSEIYELSNGDLCEKTYKELLSLFYNDFPEKYI